MLAEGPERLLAEYAAVLDRHGIEAYFPYPAEPAHHWDEDRRCWVDDGNSLSVLILGGLSYIVGADFYAHRIG